jgi:uncharacterized protein YjbJ (UPF0337 family)
MRYDNNAATTPRRYIASCIVSTGRRGLDEHACHEWSFTPRSALCNRDLDTVREVFARRAVEGIAPATHEEAHTMGSKADDMKGRAKEAAGDLTDNDDLKREGKADRAAGKVKEKAEEVVDKVRDKIDDMRK